MLPVAIGNGLQQGTLLLVPFSQSTLLHEKLKQVGVSSILVPVEGGGHGNFRNAEVTKRMQNFFQKHLRDADIDISSEPIPAGGR